MEAMKNISRLRNWQHLWKYDLLAKAAFITKDKKKQYVYHMMKHLCGRINITVIYIGAHQLLPIVIGQIRMDTIANIYHI